MNEKKEKSILYNFTEQELHQLEDTLENLWEEPLSGWRKFYRSLIRPIKRLDESKATYITWLPYFEAVGKKLTMDDCRRIENNMVRLSNKLYEINSQNVDEIDAELERRQK